MRRRLAASYVVLLVLVLAALEVPLGVTLAVRDSQRMALDRLADAVRFATSAEVTLRSDVAEDRTLQIELDEYHDTYGIDAAVIDRNGKTQASTRAGLPLGTAEIQKQVQRALAGDQTGGSGTVWPWQSKPMVVAAPIGSRGETLGAVVTISPTDRLRNQTRIAWGGLVLGGLAALAAFVLVALALARWTLKPVAELDSAAHHIADGDYAARVPPDLGPPELRRLATAFNEMVGTVSDVLERQRAFVSQASHQLRNPLTALRLRVEDLSEGVPGDEGRLVLAETDRLTQMLDSLLELASAERGRFGLEVVDAEVVAADRVTAWQALATQRGVALRLDGTGQPAKVLAVTTAVDQALDALIDNALKFGAATVTVRVRPAAGGVTVQVVDDGPGLTEEQRKHATERFWRAPTAQNTAGTGLGLPIVAVLVDSSGGRLELSDADPHGLTAELWFSGS
jgi:signal transduction histidine kinase